MIDSKQCCLCGEIKPLSMFHKRKASKDGRQSKCAQCNIITARRWNVDNPERSRSNAREWYQLNLAEARDKRKKWYFENRENAILRSKTWRKNNIERAKQNVMLWRKANPERVKVMRRRYKERMKCKTQMTS